MMSNRTFKMMITTKVKVIIVRIKINVIYFPLVPHASAFLTSLVALPVSTRRAHQGPHTPEQMSPSGSTKNIRGPCRQLKTAKVTRMTNDRIVIGYDERHWATPMVEQHSALVQDIGHVSWKAMLEEVKNTMRNHLSWKNDLHQYFEMFDDLQVVLEEDSWVWLCDHFQEPGYMKKKTLFHHSGSRPFLYKMVAQRKYADPLEDAGFHILTETLDQTFSWRPAAGEWSLFILAVKGRGYGFDVGCRWPKE
ncbi:hypothetical protein D8674_042368 [Pyrus ussuriensis x Pyrus communis]|uniref:Uncharacterized protein n=1 Tax=Pyrus ussuriensis x Pyrus communis TaxID=2448454 RepID=A0A5N5GMF7_9ROSA|nr:hypothetical protein D8674_042368 [Pyrus ussuriensis x Pyrus communis]